MFSPQQAETKAIPRYEIRPEAHQQVSFRVEGSEKLRWHYGTDSPRPYFYPFFGPSNQPLTRIGHPGAPNHDHHRSIWFAHHKVQGIDFWSDNTPAYIRQLEWLCYVDGEQEAIMAVNLGWFDGHDPKPLMNQELVAGFRMHKNGGTLLEIQATFKPNSEQLELEKTNFGFLAVRVAKSISEFFGGGKLTNNQGQTGEDNIFGKRAEWMDYSGPIRQESNSTGHETTPQMAKTEGITYFNHPLNHDSPSFWHVRQDGWMGSSTCFNGSVMLTAEQPLRLRYLIYGHAGLCQPSELNQLAQEFASTPAWTVQRCPLPHHYWEVMRQPT